MKKYVPFDKRDDVDQEHVMKIGSVKVYFFKENREQSGIQNAAKRLEKNQACRIMQIILMFAPHWSGYSNDL